MKFQIRTSTLILTICLVSVAVAWYADHQQTRRHYEQQLNRAQQEMSELRARLSEREAEAGRRLP